MQLQQPFDARTVDPSQVGNQLPQSDANGHLVVITKSEPKATAAGDGGYVEFTLQIIDQNSPHRGKEGAYRLNLFNNSPKAVEIAYKQLSALCHVTGVYMVQQTEQLHNIPFRVIVGPQKDNPQYTEVKAVRDQYGNEPGKSGQAQQHQQQPAAQQPAGAWGAPPASAAPPAPAWGGQAAPPPQPPVSAPWGGQPPGQTATAPAASQAPAWGGNGQQQPPAPPQTAAAPWGGQAQPGATATPPWGAQR